MKLNLFLSAFVFAAFYLCEAVPLRLQKRAAFYIANETACVVDNIVYSNGEPIPTDDPCEACKCRPPGFACVLQECRVKPGCRAVRHAGQCCPEYVCGCEHNGRMYEDGEEIRDAKNPCYVCHCLGSSIACAFADCLFRADCPPIYVPGECCPEYSNCTRRDSPENTPPRDNSPVPSLNLLPGLNYESVIEPVKVQTTPKEVSPAEIATHTPAQSSVATEQSSEFQTEVPSSVSTGNKPALVTNEKGPDDEAASSESEKKEDKNDEDVLLNSETNVKKDEDSETTTLKIPVSELKDQDIKTASETEASHEAEVPQNPPESVAEILSAEKTVKNSAANNSKSLKLADDKSISVDEKSEEVEEIKTEIPVKVDIKTTEAPTQPSTESSDKINSITSTKREPEPAENIAEESQIKPQSSLYSNNDKIKSETAETVTIVVHVKDKTKTTTETSLNTEHAASDYVTNTTPENLLNSKDELKSSEEPVKDGKTTLVEISSEVFKSSTEPNEKKVSTLSPLTDKKLKGAEARSEKSDSTTEASQNTASNHETTYLKSDAVSSSITTIKDKHVTTESAPAESRAEENETKKETTDELKVLETKGEEPEEPLSIHTTTISEINLKTEKVEENQTKNEGASELPAEDEKKAELRDGVNESDDRGEKESTIKLPVNIEAISEKSTVATATAQTEIKTTENDLKTDKGEENQTKYEGATELTAEDEKKAELRDGANESDDRGEKESTVKGPVSIEAISEKSIAATATTQTEIKTETGSSETESREILFKNVETTTAVKHQEHKEEATTELAHQDIKTSAQTERPMTNSE